MFKILLTNILADQYKKKILTIHYPHEFASDTIENKLNKPVKMLSSSKERTKELPEFFSYDG